MVSQRRGAGIGRYGQTVIRRARALFVQKVKEGINLLCVRLREKSAYVLSKLHLANVFLTTLCPYDGG